MVTALLCAGLSFAGDGLQRVESEQQAVFDAVAPAVVYLLGKDGLGTGFFVTSEGLVLTAAHVVEDQDAIEVIRIDGARLAGTVIERAVDSDLALIDTDWTGTPSLSMTAETPLRVGSWIASVGHGEGGGWTFTTGMVTNIYPSGSERNVFQTQIPLNPGNSGGPVVDRHGVAVGIVTAGIPTAQTINFATRSEVALSSLAELGSACDCLSILAPAGAPVFVDGRMVGTGPRVAVPMTVGLHSVFAVHAGKRLAREVSWPDVREITLGP